MRLKEPMKSGENLFDILLQIWDRFPPLSPVQCFPKAEGKIQG